jgi:hypothetical protein
MLTVLAGKAGAKEGVLFTSEHEDSFSFSFSFQHHFLRNSCWQNLEVLDAAISSALVQRLLFLQTRSMLNVLFDSTLSILFLLDTFSHCLSLNFASSDL